MVCTAGRLEQCPLPGQPQLPATTQTASCRVPSNPDTCRKSQLEFAGAGKRRQGALFQPDKECFLNLLKEPLPERFAPAEVAALFSTRGAFAPSGSCSSCLNFASSALSPL